MKKLLLILSSLIGLAWGQAGQPPKTIVAVIDLDPTGVSASEALTLSEQLRTELINENIFEVIERGKMQSLLAEQGFQQTGCTSTECAVEAGKLLNAQKMIGGSIGKVGDVYSVNLRMFDVQSGKIEKTSSQRYNGKVEGLLDVMQTVAREISGTLASAAAAAVPVTAKDFKKDKIIKKDGNWVEGEITLMDENGVKLRLPNMSELYVADREAVGKVYYQNGDEYYYLKRKNPWIAGPLSFVIPGVGQMYNGQVLKGFVHLAILGLIQKYEKNGKTTASSILRIYSGIEGFSVAANTIKPKKVKK